MMLAGKMDNNGKRESSLASFGLLAGGLAHDYNNMLTAMLGGIELILCEDIPEAARDAALDVKETMLKAATLVRRMLTCATGAEGRVERIDLNTVASDIVRIMRRAIPENAAVNLEPAPGPVWVDADAAMLWQVIMNLVANACDALCGKEGIVTVSTRPLAASAGALDGFKAEKALDAPAYAEVAVADTGCGMDDTVIRRVFEPLFTTKPDGNGLGLASAYSAISRMSGGIRVESTPGMGSRFRVVLPLAGELTVQHGTAAATTMTQANAPAAQSSEPAAQPAERAAVPAAQASEPAAQAAEVAAAPAATILVVDDDAAIVKLLKIILSRAGYQVAAASSGRAGLEAWHAAGGAISMCLIDASMGAGMNGMELCAAIRAESPVVPLVLMSAYRAKEMSGKMSESGVTTFLAKPFRGSDVLALCGKYAGVGA